MSATLTKQTQIVEAAAAVFLRCGYAEATIDDIMETCGVVRQTIYNRFQNKEALFRAAIEHLMQRNSLTLSREWLVLEPQRFLSLLAAEQFAALQNPTTTAFLRLLVKECRRFPELQALYTSSIPNPLIDFVAEYAAASKHATKLRESSQARDRALSLGWAFRAAVSSFGTVLNLGVLVNHAMPSRAMYMKTVARLFSQLLCKAETQDMAPRKKASDTALYFGTSPPDVETAAAIDLLFPEPAIDRRQSIVIAAVQVFSEAGFMDATMDDVAAQAGTSKQTVYKYFPSKQVLYTSVCESVVQRLKGLQSGQIDSTNFLSGYAARLIEVYSNRGIGEFFRVAIGESNAFPAQSAALMLCLMDHGWEQIYQHLYSKCTIGHNDSVALATLIRGIIGSFLLLRQIYPLPQDLYIDEHSLAQLLDELIVEARSY